MSSPIPVIIAQLNLSPIITALTGVKLSAKADDIVEASSELDGIIVILGGFRWIHNERYLETKRLFSEPTIFSQKSCLLLRYRELYVHLLDLKRQF